MKSRENSKMPEVALPTTEGQAPIPAEPVAHPTIVGVIGPPKLVAKVCLIAKENPTVTVITREYQYESEAPALCHLLEDQVEVICFTGPVPYFRVLDQGDFKVPLTYISLTGSSLYRVLMGLTAHEITRVTVDTLDHTTVVDTYEELGLPTDGIKTFEYRGIVDRKALVQFHLRYFRQGKSRAALTCLRSAYDELVAAGVPTHWVTPTKQAIRAMLERAHFLGQSSRTRELQVVVGLVSIDRIDRIGRLLSEVDVQEARLSVHRALLKEVEQVQGFLTSYGGSEYVFVTTPAALNEWSGGLKELPLLVLVQESLRSKLSVGIGYGLTAAQAGNHARTALKRAEAAGGNCGFVLLENRRLVGPIRGGVSVKEMSPLSYDLRTVDPELRHKAEQAGISVESLSLLAAVVRENRLTHFSAQEIAPMLGVTLRTVHRTLMKLEQLSVVEVVGEETLSRLGRPRRIYKFHANGVIGL